LLLIEFFNLTRITLMVQYLCSLLRLATPLFFVRGTGFSLCSFQQANPKLNSKETFMSSLSAKDRVSLCSFTFSDGRRCRTPRTGKHPRFCFYHAQKEARARTARKLGKDLAYFFSGDYLSACDLSAALARLIPAVVRGDLKPKTAHTVAYMAQTLMQAIHSSQHEYINAFGTDGWRNSVNGNHDYLFPPDPEPQQSESPKSQPAAVVHPAVAHPFRGEAFPSAPPSNPPQPAAQPIPAQQQTPSPIPSPALPTLAPAPSPALAHAPQTPPQPDNPPRTGPSSPQPAPNRDAHALYFDHTCRLFIDGKPS